MAGRERVLVRLVVTNIDRRVAFEQSSSALQCHALGGRAAGYQTDRVLAAF